MPRYKCQLINEENTADDPILHLFEYSKDDTQDNRKTYKKDIVALESCIFINRRSLDKRRNYRKKQEASPKEEEKEGKIDNNQEGKGNKEEEGGDNQEKKEEAERKEEPKEEGPRPLSEILVKGQDFECYVIKCPNGPYDYALKLWDTGRVAPLDRRYPKEGEEYPGLVIDRNGDYLTIACGNNIAYATKKSFLRVGVDPDDLSLPYGRLKVSLTKATNRPSEVSIAAWEAIPSQVSVQP